MNAIIHDCDPGHDDAIALMLALASPEVEVLGVTTVSGNQTLEKTTANAIRVLDHLGCRHIPVAAGSPRPLVRARSVAARVHGETGLDGPALPPPSRTPVEEHAIDWIARMLREHPGPVTLVPTGPLTNIALLLARYPELEPRIERVVLMGGAIGEGNVTPAAEFNIWADPEAARRVFSSSLQITMVGLDVTHRALITQSHVDRLAATGAAGRLAADLFAFYGQHHRRHYGWDGAPVHDAVAVAHVIDANILETRRCGVRIDTGPELSRGRTYVDLWGSAGWEPDCEVAVDIDAERFLKLLVERVGRLG
ncbi:MAG TPA: nucleoside hydrolase [Solirubrobacteraceae bacterium]|nr:nucleoside hydrolase [Solirubrobacteraceae bacterium]